MILDFWYASMQGYPERRLFRFRTSRTPNEIPRVHRRAPFLRIFNSARPNRLPSATGLLKLNPHSKTLQHSIKVLYPVTRPSLDFLPLRWHLAYCLVSQGLRGCSRDEHFLPLQHLGISSPRAGDWKLSPPLLFKSRSPWARFEAGEFSAFAPFPSFVLVMGTYRLPFDELALKRIALIEVNTNLPSINL